MDTQSALKDLSKELTDITLLLEHIKNGVILTDTNAKILYANPAYCDITEYQREELNGANPGMMHSGYHNQAFYQKMWEAIKANGFWEGEVWNRKKSGEIYPALLTITPLKNQKNETTHYLGISSDITFLQAENKEKINLAFHDPLTQLANRVAFEEAFNKIIADDREKFKIESLPHEETNKFAILFFDLNKFKAVNDTHGHVVGDKLLKLIAARLKHSNRSTDVFARFGGDEFISLALGLKTEAQIKAYCHKIHSLFESPFQIDDISISITTSIGVSIYPDDGLELEVLLRKADKAMYYAKKNGIQTHYSFEKS